MPIVRRFDRWLSSAVIASPRTARRRRGAGLLAGGLALGAVWLALAAGPAQALVVHPYICQITATSPGSASECNSGGSAAPGGLSNPYGVTVSDGDVWVASPGNRTVDQFGLGGAFVSQIPASGTGYSLDFSADSVARDDASGQLYVGDSGSGSHGVDVFDNTGAFVSLWTGSGTPSGSFGSASVAVAVDNSTGSSSGDVYVLDSTHEVIDKLDSSGNPVSFSGSASYISGSQLTGTPSGAFKFNTNSRNALAVDSDGDLYVADNGNGVIDEFSSSGTFVQSFTGAGTPAGTLGSILGVAVDSSTGDAYVVDGTNHVVDEFSSTGTFIGQIIGSVTPAGTFTPQAVAVDPSGDVYVTDGTNNVIDEFSGSTASIPDASTGAASTIQSTSTTLNGTVDPDGTTLTECRFEYGTSTSYGLSAPCQSTPSGSSPTAVSAQLTGLMPDTTYHFRLLAANSTGPNPGADQTFQTTNPPYTTNLTASSVDLNAQINPGGVDTTYHFQWGTTTAYGNTTPVPDADVGSGSAAVTVTQQLTGLTANALYHWRVVATSPAGTTTGPDQTFVYETNLPSGAGCPNAQFRTGPGAGLPDCRAYEQVSPTDKGGYDAQFPADAVAVDGDSVVWTSKGTFAGQPSNPGLSSAYLSTRNDSGWSTEGIEPKFSTLGSNGAVFAGYFGWSPDLQHMVVGVLVVGEPALYYLRNPDGSFTLLDPNATGAGGLVGQYEGASPDFSQILFENDEWAGGVTSPQVPTTVASQCTTGDTGQAGPGGNCGTASVSLAPSAFVNGQGFLTSTAYFTSSEELTNDANTGANRTGTDLYEYDAQTGALTDLTSDSNPSDASGAKVLGVVGASADGSYVYFAANGVLATGATPGSTIGCITTCNLYVSHDGKVTFIAQMTSKNQSDWGGNPKTASAQISGDGTELLFTSSSSLTGYDNAGFNEIYMYDATSGKLSCVSCNPSGAAATGNAALSQAYDTDSFPQQANISTDASRVFFETPDALVPQDTNGQYDVYEWEADGTGSCDSTAQNGGCLYLISTGRSSSGSFFAGANPSGSDVFFATRDQLVGQDQDDDYDIYDARVDGGLASQSPSPPPTCSGTGCQGPASAQPPAPTAASVTFSGPGNVAPAATPKPTPKPSVATRTVTGTTFVVRVKVPGRGTITISGAGVKTVRHSVARAGTYGLKVTLTAKAKRKLKPKHKLRLKLRVGYTPAGGKASQATVRLTVEPAAARHVTRKRGGAR